MWQQHRHTALRILPVHKIPRQLACNMHRASLACNMQHARQPSRRASGAARSSQRRCRRRRSAMAHVWHCTRPRAVGCYIARVRCNHRRCSYCRPMQHAMPAIYLDLRERGMSRRHSPHESPLRCTRRCQARQRGCDIQLQRNAPHCTAVLHIAPQCTTVPSMSRSKPVIAGR